MSDSYEDIRQRLEAAESRTRRRTLLVTLLPVLIVIGLVAVAGSSILSANRQLAASNAELKKQLESRDAVVAALTTTIRELQEKASALETNLKSLEKSYTENTKALNELAQRGATINTVRNAKRLIAASLQIQQQIRTTIAAAAIQTPSLVYLHIASEAQRDEVRDLQSDLIKRGYVAPGIENVGRRRAQIPRQTEIRYFRDEDQEEAQKISGILRQTGVLSRIARVPGPTKEPHFEIWFAADAFRVAPR